MQRAKVQVLLLLTVFGGAPPVLAGGGLHIHFGPDAPNKMAATNEVYYEGILNLYHNHTAEFERDHPFYVKVFNDPVRMDRLLHRWESHEERFEYWHWCLWKVLDGHLKLEGSLEHPGLIHPLGSSHSGGGSQGGVDFGDGGNGFPQFPSGGSGFGGQGGTNHGGGGSGNGNGNGNGSFGVQSVPEPSAVVIATTGLIVGLGLLAGRRVLRTIVGCFESSH